MSEREQELPAGIVDGFHVWRRTEAGALRDNWQRFDDIEPGNLSPSVLWVQYAKYKAWKLDQQTAKVKELRELLRAIEWVHNYEWNHDECVVCDGGKPKHRKDCWLKAEIDQLEPEEAPNDK